MRSNLRRNLIIAFALVLAGAVVVLGWFRIFGSWGNPAGWNRGRLKESERAYCVLQFKRIVGTWQQTLPNRVRPAHDFHLVIDTARHAFWIEDCGHVLDAYRGELPRQLRWRLYRDEGQGLTPLPAERRNRGHPRHQQSHK